MKYTYLLVNAFTILIPFLFSFHPKIRFDRKWKSFFPASLLVALIFLSWDIAFTNMGVWSFNPDYLTGLYLINLPLEEVLFFFCIPFSCVFTFYCLDRFFNLSWHRGAERMVCIALSIFLLAAGLFNLERSYTSVTFISTGLVCLLLVFVAGITWFGKSLTVYGILLLPFLLVNGVLTGMGLEEPVVRYNDNENLGIRLLTIPIEDTAYGYLLVLLNLYFFRLLDSRKEGASRNGQIIPQPGD